MNFRMLRLNLRGPPNNVYSESVIGRLLQRRVSINLSVQTRSASWKRRYFVLKIISDEDLSPSLKAKNFLRFSKIPTFRLRSVIFYHIYSAMRNGEFCVFVTGVSAADVIFAGLGSFIFM